MKILIVSRSFYPLNTPRAFRTTELSKELSSRGHDVTVITHVDNDKTVDFADKNNILIKSIGRRKGYKIDFFKGKIGSFINRAITRVLLKFFDFPNIFYLFSVRKALKFENGYDLIISIATPHSIHWGVAFSRTRRNQIANKWIADCGDPFMGSQSDSFKPAFYFKYFEQFFCKKADYITVPTKSSIQAYYPDFHNKILVIPQGFDFSEIERIPEKPKLYNGLSFAYAGSFIPNLRDPREFLEYLCSLDCDFRFYVYSRTPYIIPEYEVKSKGRIQYCGTLDRMELLGELKQMDFVINFENTGITETPSKLIDYALISKPILSISTKNFNKTHVNEFLSGNYKNEYKISDVTIYDIKNVASQFLDLCK